MRLSLNHMTNANPIWIGSVVFVALLGARPAAGEVSQVDESRYGVLDLLDRRSRYGQFWFVEPLRGPEMDVDRELRFDYFHGENRGFQSKQVKAELEYNFNLLTVELELPYVNETRSGFDSGVGRTVRERSEGVGSIE